MTGSAGRDIFFVSNSVDELGGVTSWSHQMARLFTARGHRVHVVGVTEPAVPQELGEVPYPTTTLYDVHPPKVRPASLWSNRPARAWRTAEEAQPLFASPLSSRPDTRSVSAAPR